MADDDSRADESGRRDSPAPPNGVRTPRGTGGVAGRSTATAGGIGHGLFDDLLDEGCIFENRDVLRPSYTPGELPHRTDKRVELATVLAAALRGETPSNVFVYGKTGTGKTATGQVVGQRLEQSSRQCDVPCRVAYVNCTVTDSRYRVLAELANEFVAANGADQRPVPETGWPTDRVYDALFDALDYRERVVVVILDEIDRLVEAGAGDVLYALSRINADLENARVSIVGISNDLTFTDRLDPRIRSSLGEEEIVFPPYDADQLGDILRQRAETAFEPDVLDGAVVPLCAAFAAREHGDARRALDLLRTAGEVARAVGAERVEEHHVRTAMSRIEAGRVDEAVRTLPVQSKLVLLAAVALTNAGVRAPDTNEVYAVYRRLCREIDVEPLTQRRLVDLVGELDMLGIVTAVSTSVDGRARTLTLSVPVGDVEAVLADSSRLEPLDRPRRFVRP